MVTEVQQQRSKQGTVPEPPAPYGDGVAAGLFTIVAGALALMAVLGEVFVDALLFLAAFVGLGVWAARTPSRRLRWVIAGLVALFVGINLVFAIGDLTHPESPGPFITTAVVVLAGIVTVGLAVLAARRRPAAGLKVWAATLAVLVVAAAGSLVAAAGVEDDAAQPGDTQFVAEDFEYPEVVSMDAASGALVIRNADRARHTFVIEGQLPAVELPASTQVRIPLDLAPGSYRYFCDIVGHEAMEGTLVVG